MTGDKAVTGARTGAEEVSDATGGLAAHKQAQSHLLERFRAIGFDREMLPRSSKEVKPLALLSAAPSFPTSKKRTALLQGHYVARVNFSIDQPTLHWSLFYQKSHRTKHEGDVSMLARSIWKTDYLNMNLLDSTSEYWTFEQFNTIISGLEERTHDYNESVFTITGRPYSAHAVLPFYLTNTAPELTAAALKHGMESDSAIITLTRHGNLKLSEWVELPHMPSDWLEKTLFPDGYLSALKEIAPDELYK